LLRLACTARVLIQPRRRVCAACPQNATILGFILTATGTGRVHHMNLQQYFPVLLFIGVATAIGLALLGAGRLLGPNRPGEQKLSPYECGFEAFGDARMQFDVRYYLVAILFILFDLEIAFLFPWAIANQQVGLLGFWTAIVFLLVLTVGFVYEWKKGALDWE